MNDDSNGMVEAVIELRENGPLIAKNVPRLTGSEAEHEAKSMMVLCRCGASGNKPFCDGSHNGIGFDSAQSDKHAPDRLRAYPGEALTVHYNQLVCCHAAECVKRLPSVFDTKRKPWILPDQADAAAIKDVVAACPSGALSYSQSGGGAEHIIPEEAGISVEKGGPYRVSGVALADVEQPEGASSEKYVLCRCGASGNKPFCDGSHARIGWSE